MDIPVFIQQGDKEPFAAEDLPRASCPNPSWWGYICNHNKHQWLLLDSETRLVLEFNAREMAKENAVYGLGGK